MLEEFRGFAPDLQVMAFVTLIVPRTSSPCRCAARSSTTRRCSPRTAAAAPSTGRSSRVRHQTGLTSSGPTAASTPETSSSERTPSGDRHARLHVLRPPVPDGRRGARGGRGPREGGDRAAPAAGRGARHLRGAVREGQRPARLGQPCRQLYDLVRGCDPSPGAWTTCGGEVLQVFAAEPLPARDVAGVGGAMGEVVEVGADGFSVACADGRLRVTRVRPAGGKKRRAPASGPPRAASSPAPVWVTCVRPCLPR